MWFRARFICRFECHFKPANFEHPSTIIRRRPVSRILSRTIIPLGGALLRALQRPTREFGAPGQHALCRLASAKLPAYLVLLRVGFTMPPALQPERCALTAPFHPYPALASGRYFLCGTCRPEALTLRSRTLSGTLPCGVRTFLPRSYLAAPSAAIVWLACQYHRTPSKCARRNSCTSQRRERVPLIFPYAFSSNYICW